MSTKTATFKGHEELTRTQNQYGLIEGDIAQAIEKKYNEVVQEIFPHLDSAKGVLSVRKTEQSPNGVLVGSNLPARMILQHYVPTEEFGFDWADRGQLAQMYNDDAQRVVDGREPFVHGNFWYDVQLMRNPAGRNGKVPQWERSLDEALTQHFGADAVLAIPYETIRPVSLNADNGVFGGMSGYGVELTDDVEKAVSVLEWTTEQASKGFPFGRFDVKTAVPVIGSGSNEFERAFFGSNRLFSRLRVDRDLGAGCDEGLACSDGGARVVGSKTAEGSSQ